MIDNVTSQYSMQTYNPKQLIKDLPSQQMPTETQPQSDTVQLTTAPPKQSSVPPLSKYIEGNQKLNLLAASLGGIFWGLSDAKADVQKGILLRNSVNIEKLREYTPEPDKFLIKESRLKGLSDEVKEFPDKLKYKDLFSATQVSDTILKVAKKTLLIAGLLYVGDYLCQKIFKNNKEYEEYYQDSLKNQ